MNTNQVLISEFKTKTENRLLKYMFMKMGRMKTQIIMLAVFSILSYPLLAIGVGFYANSEANNNSIAVLAGFFPFAVAICIISLIVIVAMTMGIPLGNFNYYQKKSLVDMNYSLPITNKERFWGDFLAGVLPIAIFNILSIALGLLILFIARGFNPGFWDKELSGIFSVVFTYMTAGFMALVMLYAIMALAASLSGRSFEAWMTAFLILVLLPSLVALFVYMPFFNVDEINMDRVALESAAVVSPIILIVSTMVNSGTDLYNVASSYIGSDDEYRSLVFFNILPVKIIIPFIIITAIMLLLAYFLGTRRVVEKVGKDFAYKPISSILISALLFPIIALFYLGINDSLSFDSPISPIVVAMIIITFIAFLLFETITKRSLKKFPLALLKYCLITGVSLVTSVILVNSNGFGIGTRVPDLKNIESAELQWMPNFGMDAYIGDAFYHANLFTSEDAISIIYDSHIESNNRDRQVGGYQSVSVIYNLKNGNVFKRNIFITKENIDRFIEIYSTDDLKEQIINRLRSSLFGDEGDLRRVSYITLGNIAGENLTVYENLDFKKIFEAYAKDYMNQTHEQIFVKPLQPLFTIVFDSENESFRGNRQIYVMPYFTNLLKVLDEYIGSENYPTFELSGTIQMGRDYRYHYYSIENHSPLYERDYGITDSETFDKYQNYNNVDVSFDASYIINHPKYSVLASALIPSSDYRYDITFYFYNANYHLNIAPEYRYLAEELYFELIENSNN